MKMKRAANEKERMRKREKEPVRSQDRRKALTVKERAGEREGSKESQAATRKRRKITTTEECKT